jgi:hypothetical protein
MCWSLHVWRHAVRAQSQLDGVLTPRSVCHLVSDGVLKLPSLRVLRVGGEAILAEHCRLLAQKGGSLLPRLQVDVITGQGLEQIQSWNAVAGRAMFQRLHPNDRNIAWSD